MARRDDPVEQASDYRARYDADPPPALEVAAEDVAAARKAIKAGELERALYALAGALSVDPGQKAWVTLLKKWGDAAGEQRDALLGQSQWFALEAVRAHFKYRGGETGAALEKLINVTRERSHLRYLETWGLDWLDARALRKLYRDTVVRVFTAMFDNRYPEFDLLGEQQKQDLGRVLEGLARVEKAFGMDEKMMAFKLMVLGKAGRVEEAKSAAHEAYGENPCWHTAVAVANALRRASDPAGAVAFFRTAAGHDLSDVTALLDAGDTDLEGGSLERALESYELALDRDDDQAWAKPSAEYCRYLLTGQAGPLTRLIRMAQAKPDVCGVGGALTSLFGGYSEDDCRKRAQYLVEKLNNSGNQK